MSKLFKNKYLIGVYGPLSEGETLLGLCYNTEEFGKLLGISKQSATVILHYLFTGKTNFIRFNGKICTVAFILDVEED